MTNKLKLGLSGLAPTKLVAKTSHIVDSMTDNTNYPTPVPSLAEVSQVKDELITAISNAENGDRVAIRVRNTIEANLTQMLRQLAFYISATANGDGDILATSGFELQKQREPKPPVDTPVSVLAKRGKYAGSVEISWKPVNGARSYVMEVCTSNPDAPEAVWEVAGVTTRTSNLIENLTLGKYYYYRVRAIGRSSKSAWSDVSLVMAA